MDHGWDDPMENMGPGIGGGTLEYEHEISAAIARIHARQGRLDHAMRRLSRVVSAIEHTPGWANNYVGFACDAAEVLWLAARTEHIETIERNLREKVVEPDFRAPMTDGRLALGRLCALQHRYEEAVEWFAKSRAVLDEQGARPLRAIVDYDEGLMYVRRGEAGDDKRAAPLLEAALMQFRALGMPGWIRRAESLLHDGKEWVPSAQGRGEALT